MSANLAAKYEKQFDEAFKPTSYFEGKVNPRFKFDGAKTIKIYSPVTTELVDYQRSGASRYGLASEMDTVIQELTLTQDKGFTKTLDRGNYTDSMMSISAGAWMNEQIKGVVTPATEKHAIHKWIKDAGKVMPIDAKPTKTSIVSALADGIQHLTDSYVPEDDRFIYLTAEMFKLLKLSSEFISIDKLAEGAFSKGVIGDFMGAKVVVVPTSYFPENCFALLARKDSLLLPRKISSYKTHSNPPGIDGWLMEGRVYYDAFVLANKCDGVWALGLKDKKQANPSASYSDGTLTITSANASEIRYTIDGGDPRFDAKAKVYSTAAELSDLETGNHVVKAVAYGGATTPFTSDVIETTFAVS